MYEIEIKNGKQKEQTVDDETLENMIAYKKRKLMSQIQSESLYSAMATAYAGKYIEQIQTKNRVTGTVGKLSFYFCGKDFFYIHKIQKDGDQIINDSLHFFSEDTDEKSKRHFEKLLKSDPLKSSE